MTERLASSALPSGPVGDPSGAQGSTKSLSPVPADATSASSSATNSPPSSIPRHHTTALGLHLNGSGKVSASIPGSVAAAVAAGLPVGGGVSDAGRFGFQSELGSGEEEWQVGVTSVWGGGVA